MTEVIWDGVKIAGQRTHDFFGDGSFYLMDLPGVCSYRPSSVQ
jgi:hypothetical protein